MKPLTMWKITISFALIIGACHLIQTIMPKSEGVSESQQYNRVSELPQKEFEPTFIEYEPEVEPVVVPPRTYVYPNYYYENDQVMAVTADSVYYGGWGWRQ